MNRRRTGWGIISPGCTAGVILTLLLGAGCGQLRRTESHKRRGDRFFEQREFNEAAIEYLNVARAQPTNAAVLLRLGLSYFEVGMVKQAFPALLEARKCGADSDELAMKLAVIYLWAGQFAKARDEIVTVLDRRPSNLDALLLLVDASRKPEDLEDARARLRTCAGEFGNQAAYHIGLGMLDVRARDLKGAERAYEAAITIDPKSAQGYMQMAALYAMQDDTNRAEAAFEKSASLAPADSMVHLRWASFNVGRGNRKKAQQILEKAVAASPDFLQTRIGLAEMAIQDRRLEDALEICETILKKSPSHPQARLLRARILMTQDKTDAAMQECEQVLSANPEAAEALHLLALANIRQQNVPKAMSLLSKAVAAHPDYADAVVLLAELDLRSGRPDLVIASLPAFIEKSPRLPRPYMLLGTAYLAGKKYDEAMGLYQRMAEMFPNDPQALYLLGMSLRGAGLEPEAAEKFQAALELQPEFVQPLAMLVAQDMQLRKDCAGAIARIERQIGQRPKEAGFYDLLGQVHLSAKDAVKAETAFKKSLELRPDSVSTLVALGQLYGKTGKTQEALASLNQALAVNSNNVAALLLSATLLQQTERFDEARTRFEHVLTVAPKSMVAANNLAYTYSERLNKPERAYTLAMLARGVAPNDPFVADTLGWILCRRGEWKRALGLLQESAEKLENQPEVLYHLGVCRATVGDDAGARAALTQALRTQDPFPQALSAKRLLAALETDPAGLAKEGLQTLEALADDTLFSVPALARIGRAHELADRRARARDAYQKAIEKYAQHPGSLLGLARLKDVEGDSASALSFARKANDAATGDPEIGLMAGRLALRHGDSRWALGVLQECANRLPDDPEAKYALGLARYYAGQVRAAEDLTLAALQSSQPFPSRKEAELFSAVTALWSDPRSDRATMSPKVQEAASAFGADWLPGLALQARVQALQNDTAVEVETLERIVAKAPDFAPALVRLSEIYSGRERDDDKAYKFAMRAREVQPDDPAAARVLGRLAYCRKDLQRSEQLLSEALKSVPQDAEAAFYLGLVRHQLGNKEDARRLLEQALAVRTDFPETATARSILAEPQPKESNHPVSRSN